MGEWQDGSWSNQQGQEWNPGQVQIIGLSLLLTTTTKISPSFRDFSLDIASKLFMNRF